MSKEAIDRFMEAWGSGDPKVVAALEARPEEEVGDLPTIVKIAGDLGYEVTEQELVEAAASLRKKSLREVDNAEISEKDLEEVAGGSPYSQTPWRPKCSSDYDPNSRCIFDDRCLGTWHYYPASDRCLVTFEPDEGCFQDDRCGSLNNVYDG